MSGTPIFSNGFPDRVVDPADATKKIEVDSGVAVSNIPISLDILPTQAEYLANKAYVDAMASTLNPDLKLEDVDLVADTNQNTALTTARTIDNVSLVSGMRVALTAQSDSAENGIYDVQADLSLAYSSEWNATDVEIGSWFIATQGDTYANTGWYIYHVSFNLVDYDADILQFSNADGSNIARPIMISYDNLRSTNIAISGTSTYTSGTKVLLTGQTDKTENGIWIVNGGDWIRPEDYASGSIVPRGTMFIDPVFTVYISTSEDVIVDDDTQEFEVLLEDWFDARYLRTYLYTYGTYQSVNSSLNIVNQSETFLGLVDSNPLYNTSAIVAYKGRNYGLSDTSKNDRLWIENNTITQTNEHDGMLLIGTTANNRTNWVKSATNVPTWISAGIGQSWSMSGWFRYSDSMFGVINTDSVTGHSFFQGYAMAENTAIESNTALSPFVYYLDSSGVHKKVRITQSDDLPFHFGNTSSPNIPTEADRFFHLVISHTVTTDTVEIWINGVKQNYTDVIAASVPESPADGTDLIVGSSFDGTQAALSYGGYMCDIMLFSRVLDEEDVVDLYNNSYGKDWTDVVADQAPDVWYKMDETAYTTSDTLTDSSTTGTGTLSIEDANIGGRISSDDMNFVHALFDVKEASGQDFEAEVKISSPYANTQLRGTRVDVPDGDLSVAGNVTMQVFSQADEPTTDQLSAGQMCMWIDTDDSKCYICYNHGGSIKVVELT